MICPNCFNVVPEGKRWCPNCGERLRKGRRRGRLLTALAVLMALGAVAMALPRDSRAATPRERFIAAHEALLAPALRVLSGENCSGRAVLTASIPGAPAILRLASVSVDYHLEGGELTGQAALRVMGATVLTGTVTYSQGLVGVYLPELDEGYYRFDISGLVDLPTEDGLERYVDMALSLVSDGNITVTGEDGAETLTCRPAEEDLEWSVTLEDGRTSAVELVTEGVTARLELGLEGDFTVNVEAPEWSVRAVIDPEARVSVRAPEAEPVLVEGRDLPDLFEKLLGGVLDVL